MDADQRITDTRQAIFKLVRYGFATINRDECPSLTIRGKRFVVSLLNTPGCGDWFSEKMTYFSQLGMNYDQSAISTMALALVLDKYSNWGQAS